ncbi:MAG TPA: hypothetical protein PLI47_10885 [Bacteroidia bacterium]|nr:hypothetical protein [Bacteroidota bacterium]MBP9923622.1 hypothetical protein [Bacteroidia bacterium]HQW23799.1 hypothetical protein [Bacteroidia bacterium]
MKLTIEKHPDISRLTHCFQKIEALAKDLGMEVDQLIADKSNDGSSEFQALEQHKEFAKYRASIFKDSWQIIR